MANTKKSNKKGNKLNLKAIESASKKFTTKTIIVPVDDVDYEIEIDEIFKTTKIEKLMKEFIDSSQKNNLKDLDDTVKLSYYFYLIFKYFTDIDIPKNIKFEDELKLISGLIDLGIYEAIAKEIPETEIQKVSEYLQKFNTTLGEVVKDIKDNKVVEDVEDFSFNENIIVSDDEVNEGELGDQSAE